jgi:tetratricopeptide (TPR) repeat protein
MGVKTYAVPILLLSLFCSGLQAENLRDPRFVALAESGFEHIFNMDYDRAQQVFVSLEKDYPQHPAPPLYLASIPWLKEMQRRQDLNLDRFLAPAYFSNKTNQVMPPHERTEFFKKIQRAENLARAVLGRDPNDRDALYFMATAYGLRASFAITIDHSLRTAFSYGNKAYSYSKQLVREDPDYYDAYLTLGIYEYTVGVIPWYMRWMIYVLGGHGSKEEGLAHLRLATEKGRYMKDQALLASMVLDVREHSYGEALVLARDLTARFPRSYFFPINVAQILQLSGRTEESIALLLQVEKNAEAGVPNFDKLPLPAFRFNLATEFMYRSKLDPAREQFIKVIADPETPQREKALSHLRLGQILEWQGHPAEAIAECRAVLSLADVEDSHNRATKLLAKLGSK